MPEPLQIEVTRGALVESTHRAHAAVVDSGGSVLYAAGDPDRLTFLRSSAKPLQALAMVESGAAERFGLTDREIAVMCASHAGEPFHVAAVQSILRKIGLDEGALACGTHAPGHGPSAAALVRAGESPRKIHDNCSGKHASMLTLCRHKGWQIEEYTAPVHPVQVRLRQVLAEMAGVAPEDVYVAVDGCNAPVFAIPLRHIARAFATLAKPAAVQPIREAAIQRISRAMRAHPEMVDGTGGFTTNLMRVAGENIVSKSGAEGLFCAGALSQGWGIAIKMEDGSARGHPILVPELLAALRVISADQSERLRELHAPGVLNTAGVTVGEVRPRFSPTAEILSKVAKRQ
ncbi:MAG: asparaginase [Chloroflexota bacterium]|nr:asparaginase [Chloroflexota bacterium]MDE2931299.1 asparaginase [Chloroflexota bacterium]